MSARTGPWITAGDLSHMFSAHARADEAIMIASEVIDSLTGRMHTPERVITETHQAGVGGGGTEPVLAYAPETYRTTCRCRRTHRLRLACSPVASVDAVVVNGVPLTPWGGQYEMVSGMLVLCSDAPCNSLCVTVTYTCGSGIPAAGQSAVRELAEQLLMGMDGDANCALPQRVTSVSRQGISMDLFDPQDFLNEGRTGIYMVDLFLRAVNPSRALMPPRILIPEWRLSAACECCY